LSVKPGEKQSLRRKHFQKTATSAKLETRTIKKQSTSKVQNVRYRCKKETPNVKKQEKKYNKVQNIWYTCGRETPNVKKQETKYITAAHGKHMRKFKNN
jgi:hypothetical protein